MGKRLLYFIVVAGLLQGIEARYEANALRTWKAEFTAVIDSDTRTMCHRIIERGL